MPRSLSTRTLGNTRLEVSQIGFGAWPIGADWGPAVPEDAAKATLHQAIDAGMNFIDTADIYGDGRSERIIGETLRERPERLYIATKMGRGENWDPNDYDSIARAAQGSLDRLGVDVLDLVQLHCIPFDDLKQGKVFEHLEKLQNAGLIRHYGASIETIEEGHYCIRYTACTTLQVIFNPFRQRLVTELLPGAASNHVGIIARVPLASGVLSGKFSADHTFANDDHRHYNANGEVFNVGETFSGVPFAEGVQLAQKIEAILKDEIPGATLAQKVLRWILDHDAVSTVIPGAKSLSQARDNAAATNLPPLSQNAHQTLTELYKSEIDSLVRGAY